LRRMTKSQSLLTILVNLAEKNFQRIVTGSWRNSQGDSGSIESLHFRRLPKCLQVVDGATNLGDCKQWGVLSLKSCLESHLMWGLWERPGSRTCSPSLYRDKRSHQRAINEQTNSYMNSRY
jgi:hypothetical protein